MDNLIVPSNNSFVGIWIYLLQGLLSLIIVYDKKINDNSSIYWGSFMNNDIKINRLKQLFSKKDSVQKNNLIKTENKDLQNNYSSIVDNHPDFIFIFSNNAEVITSDSPRVASFFGKK